MILTSPFPAIIDQYGKATMSKDITALKCQRKRNYISAPYELQAGEFPARDDESISPVLEKRG